MKSQIEQEVKIILTLNQEEAVWLKSLMQNKLHSDESQQDYEMRAKFFTALQSLDPLL